MDIHAVDELYGGPGYETSVWVSEQANKAIQKLGKSPDAGKLIDKVEYWARSGFWKWEGPSGSNRPIVHEWDGVFRLGYRSLHRLLGFYENDNKRSFIVIDAYLKRGMSLNASERGYINEVARVKQGNLWTRRT